MKRLTLLSLALLIAGSAAVAPVEAKTSRKAATRKTAAAKRAKQSPAITMKTVASRLEKWNERRYGQSFAQRYSWAKEFVKNTVVPYIAKKYPSKTPLSDAEKCRILYSDLDKYVSGREEYNLNTAAMSAGYTMMGNMGDVVTLTRMAEIEDAMTDEAARGEWMEYAEALDKLRDEIASLICDYNVCSAGGGSFILVEAPLTYDSVNHGLQQMLTRDFSALRGTTFKVASTTADALARFLREMDYSSLDAEMLEYLPDDTKDAVKNGPSRITSLADRCEALHNAWVATLPSDVQPRMADNLSLLFDNAVKSLTEQ